MWHNQGRILQEKDRESRVECPRDSGIKTRTQAVVEADRRNFFALKVSKMDILEGV